jgi:mannosyltransferase
MEVTPSRVERRAGEARATLARAAPLGGVLVLAATLGLLRAGELSLWRDEGFSVLLARASWGEFSHVVVETQANMALYYALLKVWLVFGDGEAVLRSLSALAAVGAVAATYGFAARLFGRTVGLVAALLLALNAFLVQYAQEARGYALATFLVALACLFYVRGADGGRARDWVAYAAAMSLAFYAHLFAAFVLLAHAVTVALLPRRVRTSAAVAVVAAGALAAPVVVVAVARDTGQINWISEPTLNTLVDVSRALAGGTRPLLVVYAALGLLALVSAARADVVWKPVLVVSAAALPVAVPFALSFAKPMLVDRFAIVALPAIVTLVALGIVRLRRPLFVAAALTAAVVASAVGVGKYFAHAEKEDFRAATAYVVDHARERDGIIFYRPTRRVPFEYYLRRHPGALPDPLYPTASWGEFDLVDDYRSERPSMPGLAEELSRRRTVWLFLGERLRTAARERTLAEIIALVEKGRVVAETRRYPGIEVRRYTPSR